MFKKLMAMLVVVSFLCILPVISGCQDKQGVHTESTSNTPEAQHMDVK